VRGIYNSNMNNKILFHLRVKREEEYTMVLYERKHDRGAGYPK